MKQDWLLLVLAAGMTQFLPSQLPAQDEKPQSRAIGLYTPNGWWLDINADGSGRIGYGSSIGDAWSFRDQTFNVEKVTKDLKALPGDEKGKKGSHFVYNFESERKAPDKPGPARYTQDNKLIPTLFQRAIEAGRVKSQDRGALLLDKYPPGLPKKK